MNTIPIRSIEDLKNRYEMEPGLMDIIVEGEYDQEILTEHLSKSGHNDLVVYTIASVDIPFPLLSKHSFTEGNKQRVIVLARELGSIDFSFICLVDRDLDHWFGALEKTHNLIWTSYCSIELYFLEEDLLKDILLRTSRVKISDWQNFFNSFLDVLKTLYSYRLTDHDLKWKMEWLTPYRCMGHNDSIITFNSTDYSTRLLLKNNKAKLISIFETKRNEWLSKLDGDFRMFIHGHDFVNLLSWSVNEFKGLKPFTSPEAIQRLFVLVTNRVNGLGDLLQ